MRIKLTLRPAERRCVIPINYQYPLSAAIYNILSGGSPEFSQKLHQSGYLSPNGKPMKLFVFSKLFISNRHIKNNTITAYNYCPCHLFISSPMLQDFVQNFVIGLFSSQQITLSSKGIMARFTIEQVETLPLPHFHTSMKFKTLSPIVVSTMVERNGKPQEHYYRPSEPELPDAIRANLISKYKTIHHRPPSDDRLGFEIDQQYLKSRGGDKGVSKLITIKENIAKEATHIKCFESPFYLTGSPELMEIAYECGIGQKNSMGFGMVEVVGEKAVSPLKKHEDEDTK